MGPADRAPNDPVRWRIISPRAGTTEALIARFGEPLDYALLQHALTVDGVAGKVEVGGSETEWRFTPTEPWKNAEYQLVVQAALEDLAGNRVGRAFDVDLSMPAKPATPVESVTLGFRPKAR